MKMEALKISVTTTASSTGVTTAGTAVFGFLHAVEWVQGDLAATTDATFTCSGAESGVAQTFLTLTDVTTDGWYYVQQAIVDSAGTVETYNGTNGVTTWTLLNGYPTLTIAQGGTTKSGSAILYYEPFNK